MKLNKREIPRDNDEQKDKIKIKEFYQVQKKIYSQIIKNYRYEASVTFFLIIILSLKDLASVKFTEYITNAVQGLYNDRSMERIKEVLLYSSLFIMLIIALYYINWIYNRFMNMFNEKVRYDTEEILRTVISRIPYENYENNAFHEKYYRAREAGGQYPNAVYSSAKFVNIIILMLVYGYELLRVSYWLPVIFAISIILTFIFSGFITGKQLDYYRRNVAPSWRRMNYFQGIMDDKVNQQNVQANRSFSYFAGLYEKWNSNNMRMTLRLNLLSFSTELFSVLLIVVVYGITLFYVAEQAIAGKVEIGYFSMVIVILISLYNIMKEYLSIVTRRNWYVRAIGDYYDIVEMETAIDSDKNIEFNIRMELRNIKYQYPQADRYALNGIDIEFKKGERIAVVGMNGSGKTTMIGVIMGLLKSYQGDIVFDGKVLEKKDIASSSKYISCLFQDFGQYQMTIKQNIEIGNQQEMTDDEVLVILKTVGLFDYVKTLEKGIHTPLGQLEEGIELSKGQWQKLAIARLLANKEAKIWILDEPTAHLDPIAEVNVYDFIYSLAGERLVFFISHRLGFARKADKIVVIDEGKIKEYGIHEELMQMQGLYSKMYDMQKEWYA
jgi:ATP-binding cassette, subfamily B, bacterial